MPEDHGAATPDLRVEEPDGPFQAPPEVSVKDRLRSYQPDRHIAHPQNQGQVPTQLTHATRWSTIPGPLDATRKPWDRRQGHCIVRNGSELRRHPLIMLR